MSFTLRDECELYELLKLETADAPLPQAPFADPEWAGGTGEWDFLARAVWTKDEASGAMRQFPAYPYLEELTRRRRETYLDPPIHAIEKSRRMLVSWWMLGLYLYDTLTCANHANFVGSRKLEASAYMLGPERMYGIWERIPASVWRDKPELICEAKAGLGYERLRCPQTGSYVQAIASGADQLRQYTASNVFLDEFAFFERGRETWAAVRPTIEGGGHVDLISTPELGSFMYELIYG